MKKTITLPLNKPLIIESVKNETFFRGNVEKAADPKAITAAYHEQAGDETYQERMLERGLYTALEELKTHLSDYLSTSGYSSADNSIDSSNDGDNIIIHLKVSDRFNQGYTQSLARLSSKYIEESMLMDWWKPINEKQSALYAQFVERGLQSIKRCFNKTAPSIPEIPYTTQLTVPGTTFDIEIGEEVTVTYSISEGAIDDIEARCGNPRIVSIGRSEKGFTVIGKMYGRAQIELYSRHDETLSQVVNVYVTDHT